MSSSPSAAASAFQTTTASQDRGNGLPATNGNRAPSGGPSSDPNEADTSRATLASGSVGHDSSNRIVTRNCEFCLLAEFDIDKGSTLSHQYPEPTGYDEHMLAELMLPDGAHARTEDWTIFFLKSPPKSKPSSGQNEPERASDDLTHVINLVRTKHDNSVRRGALVKSLAIGTRHPFIDIFKPVLLLALDDYFREPKIECLARLYDAVNQLDLSAAPVFSRSEKLILRATDRRDLFQERFAPVDVVELPGSATEDAKMQALRLDDPVTPGTATTSTTTATSATDSTGIVHNRTDSSSTASQEESKSLKKKQSSASLRPGLGTRRGSSAATLATDRRPSQPLINQSTGKGGPRDTHFYDATLDYRQVPIPIRIPLSLFPEEVGEYSLIKLIQTFSGPQSTPIGPLHPHLHSNGTMTHPIILLFNALVTQKRVIFLGHGQPANLVASFVLAACALGSGCGVVFRGFAARAFPYTNLMNLDELEKVPGYIAGVTNPRFEDLHAWDVLLNVETGKVQVAKDIAAPAPLPSNPRPAITRETFSNGSISSMAGTSGLSHDAAGKTSTEIDVTQFGALPSSTKGGSRLNAMYDQRIDSPNNLFMEDLNNAIQAHYGERYVRARITDFVAGFAKAVARHEEHFYGHTSIAVTSQPFLNGQLGSGPVYADRDTELREITANQMRAEGFRGTVAYRLYRKDEAEWERTRTIRSFDPSHQIARLRRARSLAQGEAELIFDTISRAVVSNEQISELLALLPLHSGGLLPLGFGLLHPQAEIRSAMVDFFLRLCGHPVGRVFVQSLNTFQRLAFARLAFAFDLN